MHNIPFNKPYLTGKELAYISEAHLNGMLSGDGPFTKRSQNLLESLTGSQKALLTHSCTAALEMAAILADIQPGDEVIMPSYTFVSTANAFVLRGGIPVFVDIRPDTLNINELLIESAITPRTKAIVPVHYAGVPCEMDIIMSLAKKYSLIVIEDAAQALMSSYKGKSVGSIGDFACISFHETKNIIAGEGGALLINNPQFFERAEIIREKGTNRSKFFRGQVDKYTWVDLGSSYLPGEVIASFLWAQLNEADYITNSRLKVWNGYSDLLMAFSHSGFVTVPNIPEHCTHNAHMYYMLLPGLEERTAFISSMKQFGVSTVFHYIPLHSSPFGISSSKCSGSMAFTESLSERIVRLPLWVGVEKHQDYIVESIIASIEALSN